MAPSRLIIYDFALSDPLLRRCVLFTLLAAAISASFYIFQHLGHFLGSLAQPREKATYI